MISKEFVYSLTNTYNHETVQKLKEKIQSEYQHLVQTNGFNTCFKQLDSDKEKIIYSYETASLKCNKLKNRYSNILAPEHTRFKCDKLAYINANIINDKYILTQGPMLNYMADFWTMIIESNANIIICLAKEIENNKQKFDPYYHDDMEKNFDNFRVKVESKEVDGNIIIRKLLVSNIRYHFDHNQEEIILIDEEIISVKNIVQIQYVAWPDFNTPSNIDEFLKIFNIINDITPASIEIPLIIHCSAGIGRSGTFSVIHHVIEQINNNLVLDNELLLPKLITDFRKSRSGLVQTTDQFHFCYRAIMRFLHNH